MIEYPKQDYLSLLDYYGPVGDINQVLLDLPYPMRLAWDQNIVIKHIKCHVKVKDSLYRILENILNLYGSLECVQRKRMDLFGGCFNVRTIRGCDQLSLHSWGIAIDIDPEQNQYKWDRPKAHMPEEVIDLFDNEGWVSLGRSRDFDYMHFQAAIL